MRQERGAGRNGPAAPGTSAERWPPSRNHFPVFAVREWAARFYEQDRLRREAAWWRLAWPFGVAVLLAGAAAAVASRWHPRGPSLTFGAAVVLAAAAVGMTAGGLLRVRDIRSRQSAARAHPATVEEVPRAARAAVLESPRLRFRRPEDGASFAALRDEVAAAAPVGQFAAAVLVWALVMQDSAGGTLEDWVRGRHL
ncbi:hypothetical protein GCM10009740_21450 [Terrabacter terrae]|uniref:DUF3093 domain-containing protein n=1 Tax=Terrabacter terrae TaxID=318434 RepID=A0ABN2U7Q3_9MICO